jgi:predicted RNA-binding protein
MNFLGFQWIKELDDVKIKISENEIKIVEEYISKIENKTIYLNIISYFKYGKEYEVFTDISSDGWTILASVAPNKKQSLLFLKEELKKMKNRLNMFEI